jgi:hydroxymethylpyrimidine pyrophosphatase-like HAD family hydrolase
MTVRLMELFCLAACLLGEPILAAESDSNDDYAYEEDNFIPTILEQQDQGNFEDVELYVKALLEKPKLNPGQIAFVIDVDGTLTTYSDPSEHQGPAQVRGNSVQFIKECVEKGIKIIVSSAWPSFEETIQRLKDIGLGEILGIMGGEIQRGKGTLFGKPIEYAHLGRVASIRNTDDDEFFRLKAFAYRYIYPDLDLKTIRHWVFGDDNGNNITLFKEHIFHLYRESQIEKKDMAEDVFVKMFYLSFARGESTLK